MPFSHDDPHNNLDEDATILKRNMELKHQEGRGFNNMILTSDDQGQKLNNHVMYQNIVFAS